MAKRNKPGTVQCWIRSTNERAARDGRGELMSSSNNVFS
jgi:hypothetical protein